MTTHQLPRKPRIGNAVDATPEQQQAATDIGCADTTYDLTPEQQRVQAATAIVLAAREAWVHLKLTKSWDNWLAVGDGLMVLRTEAMRTANCNRPEGRRYNQEFSDLLTANGLADIDKAARSCLFECITQRAAIEAWRTTLTTSERLKLNHPTVVLRRWQRTQIKKPDTPKKPSAMAKLREVNITLQEENARLEREVRTGGGDLWRVEDKSQDIARVLVSTLPQTKLEEIWRHVRKLLKAQAAQ